MLRKRSSRSVRTKSGDSVEIDDKLFIGTLGIDCMDYSRRCIDSVISDAKEVMFCYMDNGSTPENVEVIKNWNIKNPDIDEFVTVFNKFNAGVGVGWNLLINMALDWGATKIVICNNDIAFGKYTLNGLCSAYDRLHGAEPSTVVVTAANKTKNPEDLGSMKQEWNYHEHPDFSCFMITPETIERIGMFSEEYKPAYFEDNHAHHRMLLMGYKAWGTDWAPYSHIASRTRYAHPELVSHEQFRANRQQFYDTFHVNSPDQEIQDQRYTAYMKAHPNSNQHPDWKVVLSWALENM